MSKSKSVNSHQQELKRLLGELKRETTLFEELTSNEKLKEVKTLKRELSKYQKRLKVTRDLEAESVADLLMREEPEERGNNAFATVSKQATRQRKEKEARVTVTPKYSEAYIKLARRYHEYELAVIKSGEKVKDLQKEVRKRVKLIKADKMLDKVAKANVMAFAESRWRDRRLLMVNNTKMSTQGGPGARMNSPTYERFVASVMDEFRNSREEFESTVKTLPRKSKKSERSSSSSVGGGKKTRKH